VSLFLQLNSFKKSKFFIQKFNFFSIVWILGSKYRFLRSEFGLKGLNFDFEVQILSFFGQKVMTLVKSEFISST